MISLDSQTRAGSKEEPQTLACLSAGRLSSSVLQNGVADGVESEREIVVPQATSLVASSVDQVTDCQGKLHGAQALLATASVQWMQFAVSPPRQQQQENVGLV